VVKVGGGIASYYYVMDKKSIQNILIFGREKNQNWKAKKQIKIGS